MNDRREIPNLRKMMVIPVQDISAEFLAVTAELARNCRFIIRYEAPEGCGLYKEVFETGARWDNAKRITTPKTESDGGIETVVKPIGVWVENSHGTTGSYYGRALAREGAVTLEFYLSESDAASPIEDWINRVLPEGTIKVVYNSMRVTEDEVM